MTCQQAMRMAEKANNPATVCANVDWINMCSTVVVFLLSFVPVIISNGDKVNVENLVTTSLKFLVVLELTNAILIFFIPTNDHFNRLR